MNFVRKNKYKRISHKEKSTSIFHKGVPFDFYYYLLKTTWSKFFILLALIYIVVNLFFTFLYYFIGGVRGIGSNALMDCFFFSSQTISTVGYGNMYPESFEAHMVAMVELVMGVVFNAMLTGAIFSKFSRPSTFLYFSQKVLINRKKNGPWRLKLRVANVRNDAISNVRASLSLVINEKGEGGQILHKSYDLNLKLDKVPNLMFSWILVHKIDRTSPFYSILRDKDETKMRKNLRDNHPMIILSISGIDKIYMQEVHAHYRYTYDDISWNYQYMDCIQTTNDGSTILDYSKLDLLESYKNT